MHDIGTDPKTLFFNSFGSIPTMDCTWHWDWSQYNKKEGFGISPNVMHRLWLGLIPMKNKTMGSVPMSYIWGNWDNSKTSFILTLGQIPVLYILWFGDNPNYGLYMTLGLIPKSHFLTAGTDPNVTFGLIPMWHLDSAKSHGNYKPFLFYLPCLCK